MSSVSPLRSLAVHQAQIGFMDKVGRLQGMVTALPGKLPLRHPAQFVVNNGNQGISGRNIPLIPADEQFRNVMPSIRSAHSTPKHVPRWPQSVSLIAFEVNRRERGKLFWFVVFAGIEPGLTSREGRNGCKPS